LATLADVRALIAKHLPPHFRERSTLAPGPPTSAKPLHAAADTADVDVALQLCSGDRTRALPAAVIRGRPQAALRNAADAMTRSALPVLPLSEASDPF
jgi:hypothetical protein